MRSWPTRATEELIETAIDLVFDCRNMLGESVVWDPRGDEIIWVDISQGEIWQAEPTVGRVQTHRLATRIGALGLRQKGGFVVALESGFACFDPLTNQIAHVQDVEKDLPTTRLNDGRCDRAGNFVCGGMDEAFGQRAISAVYRLDAEHSVEALIRHVRCTNSICFSLDGATMYYTDMPTGRILALDYAPGESPRNPRLFCDADDQPGLPDGSTIDADDCLWNARWGGSRVVRYSPDGKVDRVLELPFTYPTCVGFGGNDYRTLFITSARFPLSRDQLQSEPHAGGLFAIRPGVAGVPEAMFRG